MYITVEGNVLITTQTNENANKAAKELRELLHDWRKKYQAGSSVYTLSVKTSGDE